MKWSFAQAGLVAAGLVGIIIILLFQQITTNNEQDYYLLREVMEASMLESIDLAYYRDTGEVKMVQEKFVENFTRRFAESVNYTSTGYTIRFYDIMEYPPKASVIIDTGIGTYTVYGDAYQYDIANQLDGILEANDGKKDNPNKPNTCKSITRRYITIPYGSGGSIGYDDVEIVSPGPGYKIQSVNFVRKISTMNDVYTYLNTYSSMYPNAHTSPWRITDNTQLSNNSFAPNVSGVKLKISGDNKISWSANYQCGEKFVLTTAGGQKTDPVCLVGVVYDVIWKKEGC